MKTAQQFIEKEMELRTKLVTNEKFIQVSINAAKQIGIKADEWNDNKVALLFYFANLVIAKDNQNGSEIRQYLS